MPELSKKITGETKISSEVFSEIQLKIKNIPDYKERIEKSLEESVSQVIEFILGGAVVLGVSDIHIEPKEGDVKVRVRIDGILQDVIVVGTNIYENLLSRLKLLSGIKLNITDQPQDGRFSVTIKDLPIEIRLSTLPSEYGESVVLRVLNPKNLIGLEGLGLRKDLLNLFKQQIEKPNGMIIVTGPTGSGKTTTLYAFLNQILKPEIKIITIEDPIEYHLPGVSQTQVAPEKGYDFANGLKAIIRQDPDVILVGEIRDLETANISLQAALTGHLVLSTLHTNDAAGTVARIQALGEKPVNIAPAINVAIGQRLIRKVCPKCSKKEKISTENLEKIKKAFKGINNKEIAIPKIGPETKIPKAVGCKDCNFTGYRGRVGIFEAFVVDDEMEKFILTAGSIAGFKEKAIEKGMVPMYQDGLIKVLEGVTTVDELERMVE